MSLRERDCVSLLRQVHEGQLGAAEAARRLGITPRQFRRIRRRWEVGGDAAVVHRGRGKPSNRRCASAVKARAGALMHDPLYEDFGPTLLAEHLERDGQGAVVHPSTMRRWMLEAGCWSVEPQRRRHRRRRPRRAARGEMVLMDSSEHDWLEGRGPAELSLVAMIDDATSHLSGRFFLRDTGQANRTVLTSYLRMHGRMGALYTDRASHFGNWRRPGGSRQADEDAEPVMVHSIIRRGLEALDITLILALSPQAKGRVERLFGTLQDRLVKEMRVARIATLAEANRFLEAVFIPFWNQRFTVPAAEPVDAHRRLPDGVDLDVLFAETERRRLGEDFTFRHRNVHWQVQAEEARDLRPKQWVTIEHRLDGSTHYRCGGGYLTPIRFVAPVPPPPPPATPRARPTPRPLSANHPWRRQPSLVSKAARG